ncbi:MAG: uspa protein [Verrucomicrobiales bacterium]|nr:uspa protein [Verrucomicrobiales bacterium]
MERKQPVADKLLAQKPTGPRLFESPGGTRLKIRKILVPVDFSDCSKKALLYAIQVAMEFCATVNVLYVVPPYHAYDPYCATERIERELREKGEQKLAALVLQEIPQTLPAAPIVRCGRPATQIIETAKELETDLIIIATHGHTGLKSVLGGTTAYVVRHAPCPVLVVREKEHEFLA